MYHIKTCVMAIKAYVLNKDYYQRLKQDADETVEIHNPSGKEKDEKIKKRQVIYELRYTWLEVDNKNLI